MIIWAIICIMVVMLNFLPDKAFDTNCRFIYLGNIIVIIGALIGLSGRPVIAASIVVLGAIVTIWAAMSKLHRRKHHRVLK